MPLQRTPLSEKIKKRIWKLWRDPKFSGSFCGLSTFQLALKQQHISISKEELFKIMSTDVDFILETKRRRKRFLRRKMKVHGFAVLWQVDLGDMFPYEDYKSFLCCIDIFSRNIYCRPLKSKTAKTVQKKFIEIFKEAGMRPEKIESDRGSEFIGSRSFFKENKIFSAQKQALIRLPLPNMLSRYDF